MTRLTGPAASTAGHPLLLAGLALALAGGLWLALGLLSLPGSDSWGYDLEAYLAAARRLAEGGSLYQPETLSGPFRPGPYGLYLYAPPLGIAVTPLVPLAPEVSSGLWYAAHVVALLAACALMPVRWSVRLVGFAVGAFSYAVTRDLALGNVSVLLLPPVAAAWRWLDRPLGQIAQAVAISVRPTLGLLLLWQLLRRQWRAVAWTIAAGLALVVMSLPFVGISGYLDYLSVLRNMNEVSGVTFNRDLGSVALELGADQRGATVALLGGYAIAGGAVLLSLRRDREIGFMVTLMASLLLSPLLWDHYLSMLLVPAVFLAGRGHRWALLLPLASWLPAIATGWTWLYPAVVIVAMLLPFMAPEARPREDGAVAPAA